MESYQSNLLRCDFRGPYSPFYNGHQWSTNPYTQPFAVEYPLDSNHLNPFSILNSSYDPFSTKYNYESNCQVDTSNIPSTYIQRSKDDMHSLFGDPSVLLTQLIDELEDCSTRPLPSNQRSTIYNSSQDPDRNIHENENNFTTPEQSAYSPEIESPQYLLQNDKSDSNTLLNFTSASSYETLESQAKENDSVYSKSPETRAEDYFFSDTNQSSTFSPYITSIERPRHVNKNRGNLICTHGLSFPFDENKKSSFSNLENDEDNDEYEADLERLLKQMDRREFQESWSKDWTLGLIRFCKYMQLSEKMQIGPAIKLKSDDNKCVILVLKKVYQAKPPTGWPSHGVRLQIQCGGFIQDILAWSSINRETWKTIMPLIAKGITQLIKKVGGVYKLKNGHQPYFNACRNALREDNSLFLLLKEYSRGVNTKKRRQNLPEGEVKDSQID